MPSQDQQPEEATTRPAAAAASFAGSLAQTTIYGRGMQQRATAAGNKERGEQETPTQDQPRSDASTEATHNEPTEQQRPPEPANDLQPGQDAPPPATAGDAQPAPDPQLGADLAEQAAGRLARSLDDPAEYAELLFTGMAGNRQPPGAAEAAEPAVTSQMTVAASAQDTAGAAARLAQGQLTQPPSLAPPAPGIGPAL